MPPGYSGTGLNPCNGSEERFASFTISLDNDGDLLYDSADPDCAPANTPPVAADKSVTTSEDTPVAITLTATDVDVGTSLTYAVVASPAHGTLSGTGSSRTYAPSANYNGSDSFTYKANDGTVDSNTATVTITINSVNDAPVAADKAVTTNKDTPVTITLTATDVDVGTSLTYAVVAGPAHGTLSGTAPNLTYTPAAGYSGSDSFTYRANDGTANSNVGTVNITVNAAPPPTGAVTTTPADGASDVPVTAVVVVTGDGSADISTVVNENTFSLMEGSPVAMTTSSSESGDDHSSCVTEGVVNGSITYNTSHTTATFTPLCPLKGSTTYTATITPPLGVQQSILSGPMVWSFTTIAMTPDSDDDGNPDAGDDSPKDCRNATPGTPKGKGKITMTLDGHPNGCFKNITATSETVPSVNPAGMPSGLEFQYGILTYEIHGVPPGETDTVTLTYPEAFPAGSKVYKVDAGGFHEYTDAVIDGNTVTLRVTDGGKGDMDGTADGKILDPVGVAVPTASGGGSIDLSTGASGGGCSVVGAGGGWKEAAGCYGLIALAWIGLALRRRKPKSGK